MTGEQSFFGKVGSNFSESARERSMLATSWYNQYFRPRVELQDEDAHWFSYRARINPTSFKSKACIIDDCLNSQGFLCVPLHWVVAWRNSISRVGG